MLGRIIGTKGINLKASNSSMGNQDTGRKNVA